MSCLKLYGYMLSCCCCCNSSHETHVSHVSHVSHAPLCPMCPCVPWELPCEEWEVQIAAGDFTAPKGVCYCPLYSVGWVESAPITPACQSGHQDIN